MSDYNDLGRDTSIYPQLSAAYDLQNPFGVFWGSILGTLGGLGAAGYCGPDYDGWYEYYGGGCPKNKLCQFKDTVTGVWVGYARNLSPEFNMSYLKWRLTGIGKEGL